MRFSLGLLLFAMFFGGGPAARARDWFALPEGTGRKDGASWENAAHAGRDGLQGLVDRMEPGDRLLLGGGEYRDAKMTVKASGAAGKPISILGQDRGNGLPVFVSNWDLAKPDRGPTAIAIAPGASYVIVRDLVIRGYQHCIRGGFGAGETPREGWRFENVDMDHMRHGFYLSGFTDLAFKNCDLKRYSKHGFRLDSACENARFEHCTADCSEGDAKWEEQTEALPVGFVVNDGGAPNRNLAFDQCLARNNMMPLQKNRYKNGDGFVVEGNSENVAFKGCRSIRNQDGGFDLKVKDVRLEDCVAIDNKRDFRIWTTGGLVNCFAGWSNEGIWTKGGPVVAERCTIAGWKNRPISTEDTQVGVELRNCLLAADGSPAKTNADGNNAVKLIDCVQTADLAEAGLVRPPADWNGEGPSVNSSKHPARGYRGK